MDESSNNRLGDKPHQTYHYQAIQSVNEDRDARTVDNVAVWPSVDDPVAAKNQSDPGDDRETNKAEIQPDHTLPIVESNVRLAVNSMLQLGEKMKQQQESGQQESYLPPVRAISVATGSNGNLSEVVVPSSENHLVPPSVAPERVPPCVALDRANGNDADDEDNVDDGDDYDHGGDNPRPCKRTHQMVGKSDHEYDNNNNNNNNNSTKDEAETEDPTSKDYYFDSYAHHAIHEEMLKDTVRTRTYEMAIKQNKHLFQDKIVLDVGCGTAILSLFCAQAGAKHVYAVDCSSIIKQAERVVKHNGWDKTITCIKGKIEDIELPVGHVDIIISEWMGYMLLYESMLDTVIYARDKWLVPNGIIFPDKAVLYLTAIEDGLVKKDRFDFWNDVYGIDMSPIKEVAIREPVVDVVDAKALVTGSVPLLHLDILTCTKDEAVFKARFKLQALRNDYIHALVCYFECAFTQIHKPMGFSTAPFAPYTHWKQTILYLEDVLTVCAGETITGEVSCRPNNRNRRDLDIQVELCFYGRHSLVDKTIHYRLR